MNLEQTKQLEHVINALAEDFYHPLGALSLSGAKTNDRLTPEQAAAMPRTAFREGETWGNPWEYAWMFADFTLPPEAKGNRIVLDLNPGGESTLFLNGRPFGTRRSERVHEPHHNIVDQTVCKCALGSETFSLAMEVYGGTPLPVNPCRPIFPENDITFATDIPAVIGRNTFGIWNEEAYQLWLDITMLREIHAFLPEDDYFRERIGNALDDMLDFLDMEQPLADRRKAYTEARDILAPVMNAHNGTFAPSMAVIGNSHLDLVWLWPLAETRRKTARTFAQQLRLLEEYPEARFLQSQCAEYELCRESYPEVFEGIKKAIARGQWIAEGGMWVEPDTNLAGGEALVRQFIYGKKYFKEQFGIDSRIVWLPDTFGYSAALPQIIKGCRLTGLTTQKIFWSYNDSEPFPYHAFRWKGLDGTEVPSYLHMFYESRVNADTLHTRWKQRLEKDGSGDFLLPFGYGDGGGGPTRDDLEQIRRQKDLQGTPKLRYVNPAEYLEERSKGRLPVFRGELYFPCHRGTYTSQAAVKKGNRTTEAAMRTWEMLAAWAAFTGKSAYPAAELERAWKKLLINQFHDILPGSAIARVYEDACTQLKLIRDEASRGTASALETLSNDDPGTTVFNPATRARKSLVKMDAAFASGASDTCGNQYPAIRWRDGALVYMPLPALGGITLTPAKVSESAPVSVRAEKGGFRMENEKLSVFFSESGELLSLVTLHDGRERIASPSNRFHLYRDLPRRFDAWDIDSQTENREIDAEKTCLAELVTPCGLRAELRFTVRFSSSAIVQTVSLDAGASMLRFDTRVDWHERHRLLKVSFDTGIEALEAAHQIQFGYIDRPAHRSRQYDKDRFEVCCHAWTAFRDATHGAAVLNDCKYGVSADSGVIGLSLLRAPTYPDPATDIGSHEFVYAYTVWDGTLSDSDLQAQAEELNIPVFIQPGDCAIPGILSIDDPAISVESVKLAEDGSGDLIARLYESMNGTRRVRIAPGTPVCTCSECNMLEEAHTAVPVENGAVTVDFRPFEIKTLRFRK